MKPQILGYATVDATAPPSISTRLLASVLDYVCLWMVIEAVDYSGFVGDTEVVWRGPFGSVSVTGSAFAWGAAWVVSTLEVVSGQSVGKQVLGIRMLRLSCPEHASWIWLLRWLAKWMWLHVATLGLLVWGWCSGGVLSRMIEILFAVLSQASVVWAGVCLVTSVVMLCGRESKSLLDLLFGTRAVGRGRRDARQ